jgi:hypothetical protein
VFLARDAPLGVVLRRGPSVWARLSLWHTDTDRFEHGQWLRGRVYERRCDLSPDGSLFVSFVRKSSSPYPRDTWVAVSRPPYFTALALWFVGGTYCLGGFFPDSESLWTGFDASQPDEGGLARWLRPSTERPPYVDGTNEWTERTVFVNRLLRDGWRPVGEAVSTDTWEHPHPHRGETLLVTQRLGDFGREYGGRYILDYSVRHRPHGEIHSVGRATWADWDQRGRLILARDGRLVHWQSPDTAVDIQDFNGQAPASMAPPPWASEWPKG